MSSVFSADRTASYLFRTCPSRVISITGLGGPEAHNRMSGEAYCEASNQMNGIISGETDAASAAELCLWRAVLIRVIEEWKSGPLRQQRQAERYLFEDEVDLPVVCQSAGIDVGQLRARLSKLRSKTQEACVAAA